MTDKIVLVADFETYYDSEYSLRKMTTEAYIRDDRFEALTLSLQHFSGKEVRTLRGPDEIARGIARMPWERIIIILQNAAFDAGILSMRYGVSPYKIICTMSMERAIAGPGKSASLKAMAERYGLSQKTVPYDAFRGLRWDGMSKEGQDELVAGCEQDVRLTAAIAREQFKVFPRSELDIIDMTVRMFSEPVIIGDVIALDTLAQEEASRKLAAREALGVTEKELKSSAKFVALLEECGEEVPVKPGKLKDNPAIAATDPYMQELATQEGRAGDLARARLDASSALTETRAGKMSDCARRGPMPIPLNYIGTHTTRWSGRDWNPQNLPGAQSDPDTRLRHSLQAPPGYAIVNVDAAQIQYRLVCALAGQEDKLEDLRQDKDIYSEFGSQYLFGRTITKKDKVERTFAKTTVLGGGFGQGTSRFRQNCIGRQIEATEEMMERAMPAYRKAHPRVVDLWEANNSALYALMTYSWEGLPSGWPDWFPITVYRGALVLPNGLHCPYNIEWDQHERQWYNNGRHGRSKIWGGAFTADLAQMLEAAYMREIMLKVKKETGFRPAMMTHDDLTYVIPSSQAQDACSYIETLMSVSPKWLPNMPMKGEGSVSETYK
jgi:DNA polymerase